MSTKIKLINGFEHVLWKHENFSEEEMLQKAQMFYNQMKTRRSIRDFSDKSIPKEVIESILKTASSAPSGANKQPWTFCVVSNPDLKKKIREAAEEEERLSYSGRMNDEWLNDLAHLGTDASKPFLETAPYLIIVFKQTFGLDENNDKTQHYYVNESVGLACGFLITAIQQAGLATLTHTPSPMNFLHKILNRPANEKPFLLLPVGYPAEEVYVPNISKKSLTDVAVFLD